MKTFFIFICLLVSSNLAFATTQSNVNQDKPPRLYVKSYSIIANGSTTLTYTEPGFTPGVDTATVNEDMNFQDGASSTYNAISHANQFYQPQPDGSDGVETETITWSPGSFANAPSIRIDTVNGSATTNLSDGVLGGYPYYCDINFSTSSSYSYYDGGELAIEETQQNCRQKTVTTMHLQTGGKATSRLRNLFGISASAIQTTNDPAGYYLDDLEPSDLVFYYLEPGGLLFQDYFTLNTSSQNIAIGSYGNLNTNGVKYVSLPDNDDVDVTPYVAGADYYSFNVSATKYHSYFDVYVLEADPGGIFPYNVTNDVGHAWYALRTDVPTNILAGILSPTSYSTFIYKGVSGTQTSGNYGYYPSNSATIFSVLYGPGILDVPEDHTASEATVVRTFAIGFDKFQNALNFTVNLHANPGTYEVFGHNCVQAVRDAAKSAGGWTLSYSGAPQYFGMSLGFMYSTNIQSTFFLP